MTSAEALRDRLSKVDNIQAVARLCGISGRQLYRIAHGVSTPSLTNADRINKAIDALTPKRTKRAAAQEA